MNIWIKIAALLLQVIFFGLLITACESAVAQEDLVTITSRGIGITESDAKKDALLNAMQQAVGSFLDSETIIENDKIIREQLLSVSDGFVKKYDVNDGPKKRSDGLHEVTITAVVQRGKVQERLRSVRVIQGSVAGKDAAAEVFTKITNADQGVLLLEKHLEGLIEKLLVARLVGQDGKPSDQVRPITEIQADRRIKCTWNVEIYFDMKAFYEQAVPQLDKVFRAVSDGQPSSHVCVSDRSDGTVYATKYPVLKLQEWRGSEIRDYDESRDVLVFLSIGRDRYGENERFRSYRLNRNLYLETLVAVQQAALSSVLHLYALDNENGVVREEVIRLHSNAIQYTGQSDLVPYLAEFLLGFRLPGRFSKNGLLLSPRFAVSYGSEPESDRREGFCDTLLVPCSVLIDQSDLEKISGVRFWFTK